LVGDVKVGDIVRVRLYREMVGKVVELRGPLGPGGLQVYRVRFPRKPKPTFIELSADQLEMVPAE
jgi:hypothetical protein